MHPPWGWSGSSGTGFDSQSVVHGNPELLLASEVAFGCLDGDVAEQELDLIQFTAGEMAETGAGAPQVVWSQLVSLALFGTLVGIFTIAIGIGPRSLLDIGYHIAIVAVLAWGLLVAWRARIPA
jgi:hypothetical protein